MGLLGAMSKENDYVLFQIYLAIYQCDEKRTLNEISENILIKEIYKIDHLDPDEPIQLRPLAELTVEDKLHFMAPKFRGRRRRNFLGKILKTALAMHPDTADELGENGGMDGE